MPKDEFYRICTFGSGQENYPGYVKVYCNFGPPEMRELAIREYMNFEYDGKWSMLYDDEDAAGVDKWKIPLVGAVDVTARAKELRFPNQKDGTPSVPITKLNSNTPRETSHYEVEVLLRAIRKAVSLPMNQLPHGVYLEENDDETQPVILNQVEFLEFYGEDPKETAGESK